MSESTEILVPQPAQLSPTRLLEMAVSQGADIEKLTALMALQERWQANQARMAFNAAMAEFKRNPPRIEKNRHVNYKNKDASTTKYSHASLDHVCDMITGALSAVGISHKWKTDQAPDVIVTCTLTHALGHSESTTLRSPPDATGGKNTIQAIGSAVTYLQRYTLLAAVGMAAADQDDDGQKSEPKPGLAEEIVLERLDWIAQCNDLPTLQRVHLEAMKMAQAVDDNASELAFIKASGARKVAIRAGN